MRLLAPAKINLHLRVGPVETGSGFHPLMSWFCTVGLFDTLTFVDHKPGDPPIRLVCDDPKLTTGPENLVMRAARAMRNEMRVSEEARSADEPAPQPPAPPGDSRGADIRLEKRIPMGGGLGGGSSNAASTLLGLNRLWNLHWPIEKLATLAATVGSDVPFFLFGPSSVCRGRGEIVRPIDRPKPRSVVLILPDYAIATPAVYRKYDELPLADPDAIQREPDWKQWADLSAGPLLARLVNDLEPPAFAICPELARLRADVEQSIGRVIRMSGSGSSLFTLFDENAEALRTAARIEEQHHVRTLVTELAPQIDDDR